MNPRDAWSDERIADAFRHLEGRMRSVEGVNTRLTSLETEMSFLRSDSQECTTEIKSLRGVIDSRRDEERKERRSSIRWTIATGLSSAGLVITAIALFVHP